MSVNVHMRGGTDAARHVIQAFVASIASGSSTIANGVFLAIGVAALSDISKDFVRKARGGAGEDGKTWPRLSPKTLAYSRRFGPGEKAELKRAAGLGRSHRFAPGGKDGLLNEEQVQAWWRVYSRSLPWLAAAMDIKDAKARAAQIAWEWIKRELGAKTKLEVFGNRPHEALRDTGVLLNSLSVGTLSGSGASLSYSPPTAPGGEQQIFRLLAGGIIVGTNVPYAGTHNSGNPAKGIPERRFIPKDNEVPQVWLDRWAAVGVQAIAIGIRQTIEQRGGR